jgi:hypothetical protein
MIDKNNNDFKMSTMKWRGYTVRALEDIDDNIKAIKKKTDDIQEALTNMKVKVAALGGTIALIVTIITSLIMRSVA